MNTQTRKILASVLTLFFLFLLFKPSRRATTPLPDIGDNVFRRRIVAVGDLHGDYPNALRVLQMAGVVDKAGNWTGEIDYFVQTGDIVGDWRYVPHSEIKTFGGVAKRQQIMSTGWLGRAWKDNYTFTNRLPYHPSLGTPNSDFLLPNITQQAPPPISPYAALSFVHGGISPRFALMQPYPSAINHIGSVFLRKLQDRKQPPPHPPNPYPGLPDDTTPIEAEFYGAEGPLWYRGWSLESDAWVCHNVDSVLKKLGVRRLIMGHTPTLTHIVSKCYGKVIIIDTGISHAYGGVLSALSISYSISKPTSVRSGQNEWIEHEVIRAVYEDKERVLVDEKNILTGKFL